MWLNRAPRETAGRSQLGGYAQEYASIHQQRQQVASYNPHLTQQSTRVFLPSATDPVDRAPSQSSYVSFSYTTTTTTSSQTFSHTHVHSTINHNAHGNTYYYTAGLNPEADPFHTEPRHIALQRRLDSQKRLNYQQRLREGNYDEPASPLNSFFHPLPTNYSLTTPSTTNGICSTPSTNVAVTPPDNDSRISFFQPTPSKYFGVSWISSGAPGSSVMDQGTSWRHSNNDGEPGKVREPFSLPITITKPPPLPRHHTIPLPQAIPASYKQKFKRLVERVTPPPALDMEAVKRLEEEEGACYDGKKVEVVGGWMGRREDEEVEDTGEDDISLTVGDL